MAAPTKQMKTDVLRNRRYRYASSEECSRTNLSSSCLIVRTHSKRLRLDMGVRSLPHVSSAGARLGKTRLEGLEVLFRNDVDVGSWRVYPAKRALDEDEHREEEDSADQGRDESS